MSQATEQIARQFANGSANAKIWGSFIFNVKAYGAKGDGVTDDSAAIQEAALDAAKNGGTLFFPSDTFCIGQPVEIKQFVTIHLNGATIKALNNVDAVFLINAPGVGDWVTNIRIGEGKITGTAKSFIKVVGGMIAQCEFHDIKHISSGGGLIEKIIRIIADNKEPSKVRVRNITSQMYEAKHVLSLESTQVSPAYSSFDGLQVENISMWCNINGGGILKADNNILLHFSELNNLYLGGQANNLCNVHVDKLNLNTIERIFSEYTGTNNTLIKVNVASENEFEQIVMYVSSEASSPGCLIFDGVSTLNRFDSFAYAAFNGGSSSTYKLFNFAAGSRKNFLPNHANNRIILNGNATKPISNYENSPIITAAPQRVLAATGMYPIYTFRTSELEIGDGFEIEQYGRFSGSDYNIISILANDDLFEFCQVGNSSLDGKCFKMEIRGSIYNDESNSPKIGVYGILSFDGTPVGTKFKEYAYSAVAEIGFRNYVSFLGAGNKIYIDGCTVTPIWRSANS